MPEKKSRPAVNRAAESRCDATYEQDITARRGHLLVSYLTTFGDARRLVRGHNVCVRMRRSPLERGLCDRGGLVIETDRTGFALVTPDGIVDFIPWRAVEHVAIGWAEDVLQSEVSS